MYCKSCGKQIPDESNFCPQCGTSLHVGQSPLQSTNIPAMQSDTPSDGKSKGRGCLIAVIVFAVLAFFAILALVVVFMGSLRSMTTNSSIVSSPTAQVSSVPEESTETEPETETPENTVVESVPSYGSGLHLVGDDLPAGLYYLESTGSLGGYYAVSKDSSGEFSSILFNSNFATHAFLEVSDGQYIELSYAKAVPVEYAPAFQPDAEGCYGEGQYRVGVDIPAGEYKVVVTSSYGGYWARLAGANNNIDNIITNEAMAAEASGYVTANEGEYLLITGCKIAPK